MGFRRVSRVLSLTICWVSFLGNIGTWLAGVAVVIMSPYEKSAGISLCVTAAASLYCAVVLLSKIRAADAEKNFPATQ
jgi:hypothetical protein